MILCCIIDIYNTFHNMYVLYDYAELYSDLDDP